MTQPGGPNENWYDAAEDEAHALVFQNVRRIEMEQGDIYDRLALLESLYDPYSPTGDDSSSSIAKLVNVTENVIASNVDTTYASVATAAVRSRFMTTGAAWSVQRRAKKMEFYVEGLGKQLRKHQKCRLAFKEGSKKGGGLVKVYADRWRQPQIDHVRIEDIYVPDEDSRSGAPPLQMHHVMRNYDRDQLKAEYPDAEAEIENTYGTRSQTTLNAYTTSSLFGKRKITVIESIRLPIGRRPKEDGEKKRGPKPKVSGPKYVPGRRVVSIENKTLIDEPYHKPHHPFAMIVWSERQGSFYPISGSERIAGHQNSLNKRGWQIDRILDQNAMITTYVRPADGNLQVKTTKIGNVVAIKGDYPQAPVLPAVHPEVYQSREQLKRSAFEDFGQNQAASHGTVPAGLETGAAVREVRLSQTQRFAPQEADFEQLELDVDYLLVDVCKDLGDDAPVIADSRWKKPIAWADVDLGEVRIQLEAASTLPRTPAGREQTLIEWAQAGVISTDSFKRLIEYPDLESEMSMYTSALDAIDAQLEEILDGGISSPDGLDNVAMAAWRGTAKFKQAQVAGAPEEVLDNLSYYVDVAAWIVRQSQAQNENAMAGGDPGMTGNMAAPQGAMAGPPTAAQPAAALSEQAMQLGAA